MAFKFPDLLAIEFVWSIIKGMMNIFPPSIIEELSSLMQKIWDSIPKEDVQENY